MPDPVQPSQRTRVSITGTFICDVPVGPDKASDYLLRCLHHLEDGCTVPVSYMPPGCTHGRLYPDLTATVAVEDSQ